MRVVLSGGSGGIGSAVSRLLNDRTAEVFSIDIKPPAEPIPGVQTLIADVSNAQELRETFAAIGKPIDILFNNAGIMRRGKLFESSEEDFDSLIKVNLKGSWLFLKEALPYLSENATILQMSSARALEPPGDDASVYTLTKFAITSLAKLVERFYPDKYVVKVIFPGPVDTPLVYQGLTEDQVVERRKNVHSAEFVAQKIVELLFSDHTELVFDRANRSYALADHHGHD